MARKWVCIQGRSFVRRSQRSLYECHLSSASLRTGLPKGNFIHRQINGPFESHLAAGIVRMTFGIISVLVQIEFYVLHPYLVAFTKIEYGNVLYV